MTRVKAAPASADTSVTVLTATLVFATLVAPWGGVLGLRANRSA